MKSTNHTSAVSNGSNSRFGTGRPEMGRAGSKPARQLRQSTVRAASRLFAKHGSWAAAARAVDLPRGTFWHIAQGNAGHVSPELEAEFRRRAGVGGSRRHVKRPWVPADLQRALDDLNVDFVEAAWAGVEVLRG